MGFDFIVQSIFLSELKFIKSEMFMVESSNTLVWLQMKDTVNSVKILHNLCEGNCTFYKQFLFFREYEEDARQQHPRKFTVARYLVDKLAYFA